MKYLIKREQNKRACSAERENGGTESKTIYDVFKQQVTAQTDAVLYSVLGFSDMKDMMHLSFSK